MSKYHEYSKLYRKRILMNFLALPKLIRRKYLPFLQFCRTWA